jgi:hypothetical protein
LVALTDHPAAAKYIFYLGKLLKGIYAYYFVAQLAA